MDDALPPALLQEILVAKSTFQPKVVGLPTAAMVTVLSKLAGE
jgi:hypothetical protein